MVAIKQSTGNQNRDSNTFSRNYFGGDGHVHCGLTQAWWLRIITPPPCTSTSKTHFLFLLSLSGTRLTSRSEGQDWACTAKEKHFTKLWRWRVGKLTSPGWDHRVVSRKDSRSRCPTYIIILWVEKKGISMLLYHFKCHWTLKGAIVLSLITNELQIQNSSISQLDSEKAEHPSEVNGEDYSFRAQMLAGFSCKRCSLFCAGSDSTGRESRRNT